MGGVDFLWGEILAVEVSRGLSKQLIGPLLVLVEGAVEIGVILLLEAIGLARKITNVV